jgi:hypothetical protein
MTSFTCPMLGWCLKIYLQALTKLACLWCNNFYIVSTKTLVNVLGWGVIK